MIRLERKGHRKRWKDGWWAGGSPKPWSPELQGLAPASAGGTPWVLGTPGMSRGERGDLCFGKPTVATA